MSPKRIQLSRRKGWRKPAAAVVVSRPTRWGNPISVDTSNPTTAKANRAVAVTAFAALVTLREPDDAEGYPSLDEIRAELAGHDLACWCPLNHPCHADVLLELANPAGRDPESETP